MPDASAFSRTCRSRITDTTVYQQIFDEIVCQAMGHGMVEGHVLYTDSTHLKADASKNNFDTVQVQQTPPGLPGRTGRGSGYGSGCPRQEALQAQGRPGRRRSAWTSPLWRR